MLDIDFFLDSGAYSAMTCGVTINIDEYIAFIRENEEKLTMYANLDVIGNEEASFRNWQYMREQGLKPVPVFHIGSDPKFLKHYMSKVDYIAVGGVADMTPEQMLDNLDRLWSLYLTDSHGVPNIKIHGFGITSMRLLNRYPWYSVDSTTWLRQAMYGSIMAPRWRGGKYIYTEAPLIVYISNESPRRGVPGKHLTTYNPTDLEQIMQYINENQIPIGLSDFKIVDKSYKLQDGEQWALSDNVLDIHSKKELNTEGTSKRIVEIVVERGVCNSHAERARWNALFFLGAEANAPPWPWPFKYKRPVFGLRDRA